MAVFESLKENSCLSFNPDDLSRRYMEERNKRIRPEGDMQYAQASLSSHSQYLVNDPFKPVEERAPIDEEFEALVIGGGWSGLLTASTLRRAGIENVRIVESGGDFGGTWYWNRYPGAQCDIQSYTYLPLLEETGYMPKERYSYAPEIQQHAQRIGRHYDLYDQAIFQTFVTGVHWDEEASRWTVMTNRGDRLRPRFVVMALGAVHQLRLPGVPGIDEFKGHSFHTSRWDYDYTGGNPDDSSMPGLADKRVAIIGTGATAIQCIPALGESAKHLYVFQRTPSTVSQRNNAPTDPEWASGLEPGWQQRLVSEFERAMAGEAVETRVVQEEDVLVFFKNIQQVMRMAGITKPSESERAEILQLADYKTVDDIRSRIDALVSDPETAEKLKPWYNFFCKRPTFHNGYLETFCRDNVTLVDVSRSQGVERITEKGIVANGVEYEVDCIVFASGFEVTTSDYEKRFGIPIVGEAGRSLFDNWSAGMRSLHALTFNGFPNLFNVGGLFPFQIGLNYSTVVRDQAEHVVHIISKTIERRAKSVQPTLDGEKEWLAIQMAPGEKGRRPVYVGGAPESCTPGYYNYEGQPLAKRLDIRREGFDKGGLAYLKILRTWRESGRFDGMVFKD